MYACSFHCFTCVYLAFANDPQDMTVKVNDMDIELRCQASDMLDTVWWEIFLRNGSFWTITGSDEEVQRSRLGFINLISLNTCNLFTLLYACVSIALGD